MAEPSQVHVIDDDPDVRDSLGYLLEAAGFGVRTYDSPAAFLAVTPLPNFGCVLTDVQMPGELNGLALQRRLVALGHSLAVVVMTGHADVPMAVEVLKAGAYDFLEKPFNDERLITAVRDALAGSQRSHEDRQAITEIAARFANLTPREREVSQLLVAGLPNKTIAYDLGTSPRTVEVQRARVMEKMGARSLADLVRSMLALDRANRNEKAA